MPFDALTPLKALSIRGPWWWMILHAGKDIENRSWPTRFRGNFLIHAAKGITRQEYDDAMAYMDEALDASPARETVRQPSFEWFKAHGGGIVGRATLSDCVVGSVSPWFVGDYGFVLKNVFDVPFQPCRGSLGFFTPDFQSVPQPQPQPQLVSSHA